LHAKGESLTFSFQDFDLWYNLAGSSMLDINGKQYPVGPTEAILMTPGTTLTFHILEDNTEVQFCHFIAEYGEGDSIQGDFPAYRIPSRQQNLLGMFSGHIHLLPQNDLYGRIVVKAVLKILLCDMMLGSFENQTALISGSALGGLQPLAEVVKYMNDHVGDPISIKDLAAKFYFNETYFSRYFKKHLGTSPKLYLTRLKMEYARRLMLEEGLSVKETALRAGFADSFSFSKQFKRFFHISPAAFKNMYS